MKIVAFVKQVPDTAQLSSTVDGLKLVADGGPRIVNPWDEHTIETAIQLKEAHGGAVTAVCIGKPEAAEALRTALAMGVDEAILITDEALEGSDSLATAHVLASAVQKIGDVDMIVAGRSAIDTNNAATAVQVAALLDFPHISYVAKLDAVDPDAGAFTAVRLLESGRETVSSRLPAVITVVKEINEPRYPTFLGIRKAASSEILEWTVADLGLDAEAVGLAGSQLKESALDLPAAGSADVEFIEGEPEDVARTLADRLVEEGVL